MRAGTSRGRLGAAARARAGWHRPWPTGLEERADPEDLSDLGAVTAWPRSALGMTRRWQP
ncbi:MAG: hypothetical protein R2939_14390 [Kofleriaceae bacterium]